MILTASNGLLEAVLSGAVATNQSRIYAGSRTYSTTDSITETTVVTNNTTAVTVIAAPAGSDTIRPRSIQMKNADTASITITFRFNASGTLTPVFKATLAAGDTLVYEEGEGWYTRALTGNRKTTSFGHYLVGITGMEFTASPNVTPTALGTLLDVELVGSGGGSGGIQTGLITDGAAIGGGGGGAFCRAGITTTRGTPITYTYAQGGGSGANTGTSGGDGNNAVLTIGATTLTAKGGLGSIGTATQARSIGVGTWLGGGSQLATGGDLNCQGVPGKPGFQLNVATTGNLSGNGGVCAYYFSGAAGGRTTNGVGGNAALIGGGAGGSLESGATSNASGASGVNAAGRLLIRHYT